MPCLPFYGSTPHASQTGWVGRVAFPAFFAAAAFGGTRVRDS